ncbi:MAG: M23 family metallopeptidase [Clostridia bacterium]|nr:M23 family metallopeptidase [Clostridia bacterium]
MENVVAARRLRKSMLRDLGDINLDIFDDKINRNLDILSKKKQDNLAWSENSYAEERSTNSKFKIKLKTRILIKVFICVFIIFSSLLIKLVFLESVKTNNLFIGLKTEYNKDYEKQTALENIEEKSKQFYASFNYAIPDKVAEVVTNKYLSIKPNLVNFSLIVFVNSLFENNKEQDNKSNDSIKEIENISKDQKVETENTSQNIEKLVVDNKTGIGGGGPVIEEPQKQEPVYKQEESSISIMDDDTAKILEKNISIMKPVNGTITSKYGTREQIFDSVDPYHTGIDIANNINTEIKSATTGTVVNIETNNKYYGKMVEIETNSVIFRYAHLNEIKVSKGQSIKQSDIIGLMGSTGMSTGPHLHFEIRIEGRSVNPEYILKF